MKHTITVNISTLKQEIDNDGQATAEVLKQ